MHHALPALLGVRFPIVQGGMTWVSRHGLAAAVTEAGGLGVIGAGAMDADELRDEVRALRRLTSGPFAVNVPLVNVRPDGAEVVAGLIDVVLEEQVPIAITGAGSARRYTAALKEADVTVLHVVSAVALALKARDAGVDALVAEGHEAGGHVRPGGLSTLALIPQVVDAVDVPVIAAGGIGDARGFVAALALGADGVQLGTRFIATRECNAHPAYKAAVLAAGSEGAPVYCNGYHPGRGLDSPIVRELIDMERAGRATDEIVARRGKHRSRLGCIEGDLDQGILPAGTSAGLVGELKSVAEVIDELVAGYHAGVRALPKRLGASLRNKVA